MAPRRYTCDCCGERCEEAVLQHGTVTCYPCYREFEAENDDLYDADELGLDPEDDDERKYFQQG